MLIDQLIAVPQREKSGPIASERFDYQALWGLTLIFKHFDSATDYAVCFEFHDDIVLLDSAANPTSVRFYQVKTKAKGTWSLTDITRRNKKKDGSGLLPSHVGKMQHNFDNFPDTTEAMVFVSNVPCTLFEGITGTSFAEIGKSDFATFLKKLAEECPNANEKSAALMHFEVADLSLNDSSTHLKGKLQNFVVTQLGEVSYNLDALYKTVADVCRARSKHTGTITCLDDLLKSKAITKSQVAEWLQVVKSATSLPTWEAVSADLDLPAMEKAALSREWSSYQAQALDQGNEAINQIRDAIRKALVPLSGSPLDIGSIMELVESDVKAKAAKLAPTLKAARLRVMILYEVNTYDTAGGIQETDSKPSGQTP